MKIWSIIFFITPCFLQAVYSSNFPSSKMLTNNPTKSDREVFKNHKFIVANCCDTAIKLFYNFGHNKQPQNIYKYIKKTSAVIIQTKGSELRPLVLFIKTESHNPIRKQFTVDDSGHYHVINNSGELELQKSNGNLPIASK